jgi:AcrR family transcriptional regulator
MTGGETARNDRIRTFLDREPADRTQAIIAAAYRLLEAGGLDGLTIRAVLRDTGLARRAFYECFAGKDDLVLAVFEKSIGFAAEMYAELIAPIPRPLDRLRTIILSIGRGAGTPDEPAAGQGNRLATALSREHMRLAEARPAELQAALNPLLTLIASQLAEGMAAGEVREGDPARMALFIYNLIATTLHTEFISAEAETGNVSERRERLGTDLWEFCRRAVIA